ncbi:phospholipid scramblase 2-like [Schistocerca cancellata]|uniref:phospholipid scramblase 2-like n=1 Tax=Schistocerca cancellata TaxID=274614 RepID=UPI002118AA9B|nr:phospholipid scramblase 2-like [Schistocerca cancellata]
MSTQENFQQTGNSNEENNREHHHTQSEGHVTNGNQVIEAITPTEGHVINETEQGNEDFHQAAPEFHMPVYSERTTITIQPRRTDDDRVPMPVSSVKNPQLIQLKFISVLVFKRRGCYNSNKANWQTTSFTHFIPLSGLDFLTVADQLIIQQTVELQDILATVESENRYLVKVPHGEVLYYAAEASGTLQRMFCGSSRGFYMKLFDQTRQQAILLKRKLACANCCCGCYLQEMKLFTPGGVLLGSVEQEWTLINPSFIVRDSDGNIEYVIEGPQHFPCTNYDGTTFRVLSRDGLTQLSTIVHEWNNLTGDFNIIVTFPTDNLHPKMKAVFLGAGFLLEYMFFETSKRTNRCQKWCR